MTIEAVSGHKKYRQDPANPRVVQVQHKHGARWVDFAPRDSEKEAKELVLKLSRNVHDTDTPPEPRHVA